MKLFKQSIFALFAAFMFFSLSVTVSAQSQSAYDVYNQAIDAASAGQYQQAIDLYTEALNMAQDLGSEGQKIVQGAQEALPRLFYQRALSVYKQFKQSPSLSGIEKAINAFETTVEKANQFGNSDIATQAQGVITQLYSFKAKIQMQQGNYSGALSTINSAIERSPDNARLYYRKATIIKNQESATIDNYLAAIDKAVSVAEQAGNAQIARMAKQGAAAQLVYHGAQRVQNENYSGAIVILEKALLYNPESVNAYYRMAQAYNEQGDWQQALDAAQQALEYANGGAAAQAKIYFAIGNAYKGLGQYSQACEAFSNADYGRFRRSVDHITQYVLECE